MQRTFGQLGKVNGRNAPSHRAVASAGFPLRPARDGLKPRAALPSSVFGRASVTAISSGVLYGGGGISGPHPDHTRRIEICPK